jgi:hypothetical protein
MNYSEITSTAIAYSDRVNDPEITANIDSFLRLVEAPINRRLAIQKMSFKAQTPTVVGQEFYVLPSDFLSVRDIRVWDNSLITSRRVYSLLSPELMDIQSRWPDGGQYYNLSGDSIQLLPIPTEANVLEIDYYAKLVPLTSTNTTNWASLNHPDAYVFGLMTEINAFVKDATASALWNQRFNDALDQIKGQDIKATYSGTPLQTRVG